MADKDKAFTVQSFASEREALGRPHVLRLPPLDANGNPVVLQP